MPVCLTNRLMHQEWAHQPEQQAGKIASTSCQKWYKNSAITTPVLEGCPYNHYSFNRHSCLLYRQVCGMTFHLPNSNLDSSVEWDDLHMPNSDQAKKWCEVSVLRVRALFLQAWILIVILHGVLVTPNCNSTNWIHDDPRISCDVWWTAWQSDSCIAIFFKTLRARVHICVKNAQHRIRSIQHPTEVQNSSERILQFFCFLSQSQTPR